MKSYRFDSSIRLINCCLLITLPVGLPGVQSVFVIYGITFFLLVLLASLAWFVVAHFGTTRRWMAWAVTVAWGVYVVGCLLTPYTLIYSEVTELRPVVLPWGEAFNQVVGCFAANSSRRGVCAWQTALFSQFSLMPQPSRIIRATGFFMPLATLFAHRDGRRWYPERAGGLPESACGQPGWRCSIHRTTDSGCSIRWQRADTFHRRN